MYDLDQIISSDDPDDIEALQRLQDLVNRFSAHTHTHTHTHYGCKRKGLLRLAVCVIAHRTQWKKCTFSGDGDFIVAGKKKLILHTWYMESYIHDVHGIPTYIHDVHGILHT